MRDQIEAFLKQRSADGAADASIESYQFRLQILLEFAASKDLDRWQDFQTRHIDRYPAWMKNYRGLAFRSIKSVIATTREFFGWLSLRGKIVSDPSVYLRLRSCAEDEPLPSPPLSESDVAAILAGMPRRNAIDLRNAALVELLYSAGLRLSEAISLNVADIGMDSRIVLVTSAKRGKPRDIPMVRGLHHALSDYLCLRRSLLKGPDSGALLLSQYGRRLGKQSVHNLMRRINRLRLCQQHVHAHLFRHSIAVHLLRGGADIRYIQQFLGHELLETTKVYLRLVPADIEDAYRAAMPEFSVGL